MTHVSRRLFLIDGPSLVYRAFFALPESIATSTGVPTNAIFGFASMLVKIVTEYGVCPTVVAWDAGTSGRNELFADYKASRRSRPDLLKQQWPAMEPLVEAFGYSNVRLEGYEADDVIASIAERAIHADPPVEVMIVTGDRDVFQLIDERGLIKVMATARGITDTKIYDRQAVIDRYGIPPESIPDFYGLKGDTSDNIPGIPGIGDKTASELLQSFGTLEEVLANVDQIKGPKRKANLVEFADDARMSRELATVKRDLEVDLDISVEAAREPDRSRVREVFREYELRDPLRRLEEALGDPDVAAPPSTSEVTLTARMRAGSPAEISRLAGEGKEICVVVAAAEAPEGELFAEGPAWRFAAAADGQVLAGECSGPEEVVAACAGRGVVAHDAKALRVVPERLVHDTLLGAYLLEPARRGYPFAELCEERGLASDLEDPLAAEAVMLGALADWQREQIAERGLEAVMEEIELPLVRVLRELELLGRATEPGASGGDHDPCPGRDRCARTRDLPAGGHGVHDRLAAAARRDSVRASGPVAQASRQDGLLDRCPGAAGDPRGARDRAADRALARALHADQDLPRRAAGDGRRSLADSHHVPAGRGTDRTPLEHQPEHAERARANGSGARDTGLLRG